MPIILARKRTPEEFATFVVDMAQLNPNGFRNPGKHGTSLVEQAFIKAGSDPKDFLPGPSARGLAKRRARARHREQVRRDQLHGLEHSRNRRHGRNKQRQMIYIGSVKKLQGETALVRFDRSKDEVMVQFDNLNLPKKHTHGWTEYDPRDFRDAL